MYSYVIGFLGIAYCVGLLVQLVRRMFDITNEEKEEQKEREAFSNSLALMAEAIETKDISIYWQIIKMEGWGALWGLFCCVWLILVLFTNCTKMVLLLGFVSAIVKLVLVHAAPKKYADIVYMIIKVIEIIIATTIVVLLLE